METPAEYQVQPTPEPEPAVVWYVDTDNQVPAMAEHLHAMLADLRRVLGLVVLAGNDHGQGLMRWAAALAQMAPGCPVEQHHVPAMRHAADLALVLAMGAHLEQHQRQGDLIDVVSRDECLIAAAGVIAARGLRTWLAYAHSDIPPARSPLPTLLVPAVPRNAEPETVRKDWVDPRDPQQMLEQLRAVCPQQKGGGYRLSDVGQALSRVGLRTQVERRRFLVALPGVREEGDGPNREVFI